MSLWLVSIVVTLVGRATASTRVAFVVCREEINFFADVDCHGYERIVIYPKCGDPDGALARLNLASDCVDVVQPPTQKFSNAAKAEETFLWDMIQWKKETISSSVELLVYLKASTFTNVSEWRYMFETLPKVSTGIEFASFSYGRTARVDFCKHPHMQTLRKAKYSGACKGWVSLRDSFAVSASSMEKVPLSVLEAMSRSLAHPKKVNKAFSAAKAVGAYAAFVERFWQLLFGCVSIVKDGRVCLKHSNVAVFSPRGTAALARIVA